MHIAYRWKYLAFVLAAWAMLCGCNKTEPTKAEAAQAPTEARIVSVGGSVTETVFALGMGPHVVAVDTSSLYPEKETTRLPKVGYQRTLSAEGILALRPTLLLASSEAGPPPVLQQIRAAGVRVETIPEVWSLEGVKQKVRSVAKALDRAEAGEVLASRIDREVKEAQAKLGKTESRPRVLPLYARGHNQLLVFGRETAADAMLELAHAENVAATFEGAKPLTPEAVVTAAPDVVLLPSRGLESVGETEGVLDLPGLAETPAGKAKNVVSMDDLLLLGFGPRLGEAISQLGGLLHADREAP